MENQYKVVDMDNWNRKLHCGIFRNSAMPCYCITVDIDITDFYAYVKKNKLSFTLSFIHAVSKCANETENFRYRFKDGDVVIYDKCNTEFTYLNDGNDLFYYVCVQYKDDMEEYVRSAQKIISEQKTYCAARPANDAFQFSPMPWFSYTSVSHTFSGDNTQSNPMFDWGKFYEMDGRKLMPFSVQVHHSFVNGVHIAGLIDCLGKYLETFKGSEQM